MVTIPDMMGLARGPGRMEFMPPQEGGALNPQRLTPHLTTPQQPSQVSPDRSLYRRSMFGQLEVAELARDLGRSSVWRRTWEQA